jgi:hypothetical protein
MTGEVTLSGKVLPQTCQSFWGNSAKCTYARVRIDRCKPVQSDHRWNLEAAGSEVVVGRGESFIPVGNFLAKLR